MVVQFSLSGGIRLPLIRLTNFVYFTVYFPTGSHTSPRLFCEIFDQLPLRHHPRHCLHPLRTSSALYTLTRCHCLPNGGPRSGRFSCLEIFLLWWIVISRDQSVGRGGNTRRGNDAARRDCRQGDVWLPQGHSVLMYKGTAASSSE